MRMVCLCLWLKKRKRRHYTSTDFNMKSPISHTVICAELHFSPHENCDGTFLQRKTIWAPLWKN